MNRSPRGIAPQSRLSSWRPSQGASIVMAVEAGVYFLLMVVLRGPAWISELALSPAAAIGPKPWQLFTSGFVHTDVRSLIFDLIGIWFIGSMIEQRLGLRRMLIALGASQLAGALLAALLGRALGSQGVMTGCAFGITGLVAGIGALYWSVPMSMFGTRPIKGRYIAMILIAISVVQIVMRYDWVQLAGTLAAVAAGALAVKSDALTDLRKTLDGKLHRLRIWRLRRRYKVIDGGNHRRPYVN